MVSWATSFSKAPCTLKLINGLFLEFGHFFEEEEDFTWGNVREISNIPPGQVDWAHWLHCHIHPLSTAQIQTDAHSPQDSYQLTLQLTGLRAHSHLCVCTNTRQNGHQAAQENSTFFSASLVSHCLVVNQHSVTRLQKIVFPVRPAFLKLSPEHTRP